MKLEQRSYALLVSGILAVVLVSVVSMVPAPFALMRPGPVKDVLTKSGDTPMIAISGHQTYPTSGSLDLTTVRVSGGPGAGSTVWELLGALTDNRVDARPVDEVFPPDQTREEIDETNAAEMVSSQEAATAAALTELGITVPSHVTIVEVSDGSGAEGKLTAGDVVVSVNGQPVDDAEDIRVILAEVSPGQSVTVGFERDRKPGETSIVTTSTENPDGTTRTLLGVQPGASYDFPFDVKISINDIGGPSAGMIFSLGIIDKLTPGELTGGERIAGTGTITSGGTVGAIGGIRQKVFGAQEEGATWFLAPSSNCAEIHDAPDGITVVPVATLHQAHEVVKTIGSGDSAAIKALPTCGS